MCAGSDTLGLKWSGWKLLFICDLAPHHQQKEEQAFLVAQWVLPSLWQVKTSNEEFKVANVPLRVPRKMNSQFTKLFRQVAKKWTHNWQKCSTLFPKIELTVHKMFYHVFQKMNWLFYIKCSIKFGKIETHTSQFNSNNTWWWIFLKAQTSFGWFLDDGQSEPAAPTTGIAPIWMDDDWIEICFSLGFSSS